MPAPRPRREEAPEEAAKEAALRLLARGPRTEQEVIDRLLVRGFEPGAVEAAVERLRRVALLDDREFTRSFLRRELPRRPQGRVRIAQTLRRRGVPASVISELDALLESDEELAGQSLSTEEGRAERAAQILRVRYRRDEPLARRRRLEQALFRRGFSWDLIRDLLEPEPEGET